MDDCRFDLGGEMFNSTGESGDSTGEAGVITANILRLGGFCGRLCVPKREGNGSENGSTQKRMRDGSTPGSQRKGRAKVDAKSGEEEGQGSGGSPVLEYGRAVGTGEWDGRLGQAGGWDGRLGRAVGTGGWDGRLGRAVGPVNDGQRGAGREIPLNPSGDPETEKICRLIPADPTSPCRLFGR